MGPLCCLSCRGYPEALVEVKFLFSKEVLLEVRVLQSLDEECEDYLFTEVTIALAAVTLDLEVALSSLGLERSEKG